MIYDDIKVAAPLSINDICRQLKEIPYEVNGEVDFPSIQTCERIAEKITTFLTTNETIIRGARDAEIKTMHDCLVRELEGQSLLHQMMEASLLAKVSLDDCFKLCTGPLIGIGLNRDEVKTLLNVNAALLVLGYKPEELKGLNIPEDIVNAMKERLSSPEYKREAAAFLDVDKPIFKSLQKMKSLISVLETKQSTNGWLFGYSCVIL